MLSISIELMTFWVRARFLGFRSTAIRVVKRRNRYPVINVASVWSADHVEVKQGIKSDGDTGQELQLFGGRHQIQNGATIWEEGTYFRNR